MNHDKTIYDKANCDKMIYDKTICDNRSGSGEYVRRRSDIRARRRKAYMSGHIFESVAAQYMQRIGMKILARRYRTQVGEIDVVAQDGETIVFCEVKYRESGRFGGAISSVSARQQKRIRYAAMGYLAEHNLYECVCRFDVAAFDKDGMIYLTDAFRGGDW